MRKLILYISYLFSLLLVTGTCGCSDTPFSPEFTPEGDGVYSIQVTCPDIPNPRAADVFGTLNLVWRYGDELILSNQDGTKSYTFTLLPPQNSTLKSGDEWDTSQTYPTFTYKGAAIPSYNNFSGKLVYKSIASKETEDTGVQRFIPNQSSAYGNQIKVLPYRWQKANNSSDHLKGYDNLSATLTNFDFTSNLTITLERDYFVLKIIVDGFYYPIYGGSMLFVRGFGDKVHGLMLGENKIFAVSGDLDKYSNDIVEESVVLDNAGTPFCDVPSSKNPITGYAERDGSEEHKITVYLVINGSSEIEEGHTITVGIREVWSCDWYFWETEPLKNKNLYTGMVYTLDFTKKAGSGYVYEPTVAINTGYENFSHMATKNLGAESVSDAGDYFMFGFDTPVRPGGHYQNYPNPTPYFYYNTKLTNKYELGFGNANNTTGGTVEGSYTFLDAQTNPSKYPNAGSTRTIGKNNPYNDVDYVKVMSNNALPPREWWRLWANELTRIPFVLKDLQIWTPPGNVSFGVNSLPVKAWMGRNEIVTTGNGQSSFKLKVNRTGHVILIPISGKLVPPSLPDPAPLDKSPYLNENNHQIGQNATAQFDYEIFEDNEPRAYFGALNFFLTDPNQGKSLKTQSFYLTTSNLTQPFTREYNDLYTAIPIRPIFYETSADFYNFILNFFKTP